MSRDNVKVDNLSLLSLPDPILRLTESESITLRIIEVFLELWIAVLGRFLYTMQ